MSEERLTIGDYPLAEKRPEIVRGKRGKGLDEITLEAVLEDRVALEDLRITATALRQQAEIARAAGRETLAENFERAAELVDVSQGAIMRVYELLRPGRAGIAKRASRRGPGAPRAIRGRGHGRVRGRGRRRLRAARSVQEKVLSAGMTWKTDYRSIYYDGAPEPDDPDLAKESTALLVIDVQNTYLVRPDRASLSADEQRRYDAWTPFHERMRDIVIPRTRELLSLFRANGYECLFARIACHTKDGRDRSLSQKKPGWNNLLLPKDEHPSQLVAELGPQGDQIVVTRADRS